MTEPRKEMDNVLLRNDNEKAEVSEHKGIIANVLALGSRPIKKMIQTLNPFDNEKAGVSEHQGIIANILALRNRPIQLYNKMIQTLNPFGEASMTEHRKEIDNEKAEVSEHQGIIANILALRNQPIQLYNKMIQTLNPFGIAKAEDDRSTGIVARICERGSQPFQLFEKFRRFSVNQDNEKTEVSEPQGIIANILALGNRPIQLYHQMIQTLNHFDKLEKENDELRKELEWRRARNKTDDITLNAETAHPYLSIAGDKKSLKYEVQQQKVPPTPERFDSTVCVLGSEGFSSEEHYWEVDVGSSTDWDLGVARKSIQRKGKISLSPKEGFWALGLKGRDYWAKTDPWTRVTVQKKPKKIGVYLSYQEGRVTFFSLADMSVLFTFNDCSFSEVVYPFFKNSHKETAIRISSIKEEE
ncbi:tripartite motif-containing protein 15-like isoform X2 [Malaclemys terrapin pileata]|uniref:tripartite motif-containing protein 15-like isoform X2 n=1 Tax=Malaclemys terrapin pileata TaxID=2991368 RepID=UPI0023A84231|nr:tripartite motif-containing protein 15-like isoform X2 [Malaclemys terrapin pileata]